MAVNLTVDLENATFADLVALVEAARVAGVDKRAKLELEDTTLHVTVEPGAPGAQMPQGPHGSAGGFGGPRPPATPHSPLPQLGDAAIRSVIDILTGRQEPPRP